MLSVHRKKQQRMKEEHEAFKNRLVDEVLGESSDLKKLPMEKVVMLMWQFRDDPAVVTFMARFVSKFSGSRHVLDGIEFYLPQLAHMIIHLEVEWDDAILERFALVIAQQSVHFALQLNWILQGALQDYQPELEDTGVPNPTYHPLFYSRCLKLLKNVERCVVYGKSRAQELARLYEQGKITKKEMVLLEQADRRFNALQITADTADLSVTAVTLDGWFLVQLPHDKDESVDKFVQRFCVLEKNVLNCYKSKGCSGALQLERAMSLERANVAALEEKNGIKVETANYEFVLRCSSAEEQTLWVRRLREEADTSGLFSSKEAAGIKEDLTPDQLDRYDFFQNERQFVQDLTDIAEDLRFVERSDRKKLAPGKVTDLNIPEPVYLPLCNSSDIWRRVSETLPKETRVFNTKERCPIIMNFVSRRGEPRRSDFDVGSTRTDPNLDVADYLHLYFDVVEEKEKMEDVAEGDDEDESKAEEDSDKPESEKDVVPDKEPGAGRSVWLEDEDEPQTPAASRKGGNRRVQRLMRESVVDMPNKLAKRLKPGRAFRGSVMDRQTTMQPLVPILEGSHVTKQADETDNVSAGQASLVSVEQSSVMFKDQILFGDLDEGDIDLESIDRAKKIICGGESWAEKSARMLEAARRESEEQGESVQLEIANCMAKSNDDLRQEVFVMQMIHYYKSVFAKAKLPLWLKTYRILSVSSNTGLLEVLTDATSIDGLKKSEGYPKEGGLRKYFEEVYGGPDSKAFKAAQTNFMQSLAAYALVSYLLGLKDRHNGNIMIDTRGHLIFIDFGFALGMAPGHEFSFERAPFKLTKDYIDVMGGVGSECYAEFERLFVAGFEEARENSQIALGMVEIMMYKSNYPCFSGWRYGKGRALGKLEQRLMLRVPDKKVKGKALRLIRKSKQNFGTYLYDAFQHKTNGYAM